MCVCVCVQISSLKPLGQLKPNFMWNLHRIGSKVYSNGPGWGPGHLLFFIIANLRGTGAFSRDFTINLSPQCRAFSSAFKTEKLKAPLFPGPVGAETTNDWCITFSTCTFSMKTFYSKFITKFEMPKGESKLLQY